MAQPKKNKNNNVCNICKLPDIIEYQEKDRETGKTMTKTHRVGCLGHIGIHPLCWNMHPEHMKFRKWAYDNKLKNKESTRA